MKILIAVDKSRHIYLKPFSEKLSKYNIQTKIVDDLDIYKSTNNKKILRWFNTPSTFNKILNEFKPDLVFTERTSHFCSLLSKHKIPFVIFLRGDYWEEYRIAKQESTPLKKIELISKNKIATNCFNSALAILPICNYLEKITNKNFPHKKIFRLYQGIDIENWKNNSTELKLCHPCIGFLQSANIAEKAKEMKILSDVIDRFPNITFYWAGDGPYRNEILRVLDKFENFKWLGQLEYPNQVKEFLSEIDIYGLCTGLDMSPHTILEAGILKKPTIATDVGGVSESIMDNKTGFLVQKNNPKDWVEKIEIFVNEPRKILQMGNNASDFVQENYNWGKITLDFLDIIKNIHKENQDSD